MLYELNEFTETEKLRILEIVYQVSVEGQKKGNRIQRNICKIFNQMIQESMNRVYQERDNGNER